FIPAASAAIQPDCHRLKLTPLNLFSLREMSSVRTTTWGDPRAMSAEERATIMAFIAECPFCHIKLQKVPDYREGSSLECPRCKNLFTLTVMISPPKPRASTPKIVVPKVA